MNHNKFVKIIIVFLVVLLLGVGAYTAYYFLFIRGKNPQDDNVYLNDGGNEYDDDLTLEEQYPYYEFVDVEIYDEETNGEELPINGDEKYYKDFALNDNQILHINYDRSMCKEVQEDNCVLFKEKGNIIYVNYLYEESAGAGSSSSKIYVIDRQGYLFQAMINSMEIDRYSNEIVTKIGYRQTGNGYLLVFEDDSVLEFSSTNTLELNDESIQ